MIMMMAKEDGGGPKHDAATREALDGCDVCGNAMRRVEKYWCRAVFDGDDPG